MKKKYTNKKPYKGKFVPTDPKKYRGNPRNIIYRSMWERNVMVQFDRNENIVEWSSEEVVIPYVSPWDNQIHRYYPDFYLKVKAGRKEIVHIIEIKPKKQTVPPKTPKRKTKNYLNEVKMWGVNTAKWKAAEAYCDKRGWNWAIWTEDTLRLNW